MKKYVAILAAIAFAFALSCSIATVESVYAEDSDTVIYDADDFANLSGRTQSDVMEKYTEAMAAGTTYLSSSMDSYYDVPASVRAPYAAGVLSSDTLEAMAGMTNFYRWLIGVESLSVNKENIPSLQYQALDRNFQFAHEISNDSKPADMDDALWAAGFECDHNILASGYNPSGAITGWMNEGYNPNTGKWDAVGHRTAILFSWYKSISYGYSGYVAIGKCGDSGNTFTNAFATFPAAGYMPTKLVYKSEASWTVELNTSIVKASNPANVEITVENLTTGATYTCKQSDNTAQISSMLLNFIQPTDATSTYYTDSYKVTATGLTDVATGKDAAITYTVNFFSPNMISSISIPQTKFAYTGNEITPEVTVTSGSNTLVEGQDYTLTYHNNVEAGTAIVEVRGIGNYCGTAKKTFSIEVDRKNMDQCAISLSPTSARYNGSEIKPTVTVTSFGNPLTEGEDFEVAYRDNIEPGTGVAIVSGIGEYSGSVEKTFTINKGAQSITRKVSAYTVEVGDTATITASAKENAPITFESSDESIATVDADGTVHALSAGDVTIKITAGETEHYSSVYTNVYLTMSTDIHTMVDTDVVYADENNETATVTKVCSVCGKEETTSFTTMRSFRVWYWTGDSGSSGISSIAAEGDEHDITFRDCEPSDAGNKQFVLETSDENVMEVNNKNLSFKFVGAGNVTLTIKAKYRPSVKITRTFTVNHVFDEGEVIRPSTCSEKGEIKYTCTKCGAVETGELALDANNHTGETVLKNAKDPTCTEAGYTGDTCCAGCNVVLEPGETISIDQNAHDWDEATYEWAADNSSVTATRVCKRDASHKQTETVSATPDVIKDATCVEEGEVKYTSDAFENEAFGVQTKTVATAVDPAAHGEALTHTAAKEETCTTDGNVENWHCANCGKYFADAAGTVTISEDDLTIPALGHAYVEVADSAVAPTCEEPGKEADQKCSRCQDLKTGAAIDALGHEWEEPVYTWEDDYSAVTATRHCANDTNREHSETETVGVIEEMTEDSTCSKEGVLTYTSEEFKNPAFEVQTETVAIAMKDHTPGGEAVENEVEPTCTMPGSYDKVVRCSVCGSLLSKDTVTTDPIGHNFTPHEAKAPTCTEAGWEAYWDCANCHNLYADDQGNTVIAAPVTLAALGHKYEALGELQAATPEAPGKEPDRKCSNCQDVIKGAAIASPAAINFAAGTCTYNGKAWSPALTVIDTEGNPISESNYEVTYSNNVNAGTAAKATVEFTGARYAGSMDKAFTINKAAQKMTVKAATKTLKVKKLKKKAQTVSAITVTKQGGAVTYKKLSGSAKLTVNAKTGKITVKKKTKKGTYKIKVRATSAANVNYKAAYKDVTVTVKVKK